MPLKLALFSVFILSHHLIHANAIKRSQDDPRKNKRADRPSKHSSLMSGAPPFQTFQMGQPAKRPPTEVLRLLESVPTTLARGPAQACSASQLGQLYMTTGHRHQFASSASSASSALPEGAR